MIKIKEITQTCESSPAQWEAKSDDGKMVYIRYRWGDLTVKVAPEPSDDIYDAVKGTEVFKRQLNNDLHGWLSYEELKTATNGIIKFPEKAT
jgi:hypothetical protein